MIEGYNIALKLDGKTILGRTQDDLNVSATTKESITKDDNGVKKVRVVGHEVTFSVSALMELGPDSNKLTADDVMELALAVGDDAVIPVIYVRGNGKSYKGDAIITSYGESSSADADADTTVSINLRVTGDFVPMETLEPIH